MQLVCQLVPQEEKIQLFWKLYREGKEIRWRLDLNGIEIGGKIGCRGRRIIQST